MSSWRTCNDEGHGVVGRGAGEGHSKSALIYLTERLDEVHHHVDLRVFVELRLAPVNRVIEQVEAVVGRLLELTVDDHRVIDVDDDLLTSRQHEQSVAWSPSQRHNTHTLIVWLIWIGHSVTTKIFAYSMLGHRHINVPTKAWSSAAAHRERLTLLIGWKFFIQQSTTIISVRYYHVIKSLAVYLAIHEK